MARITPEQYLEIERKAEFRSEYYAGEMFERAISGAAHVMIAGNLAARLHEQLRSRTCKGFIVDMRIRVSAGLYAYPDICVVCDEAQYLDDEQDTLLNPHLIVEVLSPSTEAYDRGRKFEHYRSLPSLKEYLLIASDRVSVELFRRHEGDAWLLTAAKRLEDSIELASVGCRVLLADIYKKVQLDVETAL